MAGRTITHGLKRPRPAERGSRGYTPAATNRTVLADESYTESVGVVASGSAVRVAVVRRTMVICLAAMGVVMVRIGVRAVLDVAGHGLGPDQGADARPDHSGLGRAAEGQPGHGPDSSAPKSTGRKIVASGHHEYRGDQGDNPGGSKTQMDPRISHFVPLGASAQSAHEQRMLL